MTYKQNNKQSKKFFARFFTYAIGFTTTFLLVSNRSNAQANKSLSNLAATTKINTDLLPDSSVHSLGSASKSWKEIFAASNYYLAGSRFINAQGNANTFIGSDAGHSNTTGYYNTSNGFQTLFSNTTGASNIAIGPYTLNHNTIGNANVAAGSLALFFNTTGYYNAAFGESTLYSNTTGFFNVATGGMALYDNTTGFYNTASGAYSMFENTTGNYNVAMGANALTSNDNGTANTAIGENAMYRNINGNYNTATGIYALYSNSTGAYNTADGMDAMRHNVGGYFNTALGSEALNTTSNSYYNTAVGYNAGGTYDNGWNNVFLGANTTTNYTGYYNDVAIGQATVCTASNQVRLGNTYTTSIGGYANWSNISDGRVKKNIKQNVPGLAFINKLQPVTYNLDLDASDKLTQHTAPKDKDGKPMQLSQQELTDRKNKERVVYTGFIAQDVEKAAKSLNYDFSGVDAAKNDKDLYALRYSDFVVPLVKAVQELSVKNDSLQRANDALEKRVEKIEAMMNLQQTTSNDQPKTTNISSASIEQNIPNPFSNTTIIRYTLPQKYVSAKIILTDKLGNVLKEVNISTAGKGSTQIAASTLAKGSYQYSLMVDGKIIGTKQMVCGN